MKFFLETLGCQMNKLDSELVASSLMDKGYTPTDEESQADIILYNTCSVRQHAENKVLGRVGRQCRRKRDGIRVIVVVFGCMAQRVGDELMKKFDGLDMVCGSSQIDSIAELVSQRIAGGRRQVKVDPPRAGRGRNYDRVANCRLEKFDTARPSDGAPQAFVRIQRGCDTFCSYCIVPHVRGTEQSRSAAGIIEEVKRLTDAGCIEVTLIGQTVNHYCYTDSSGKTIKMPKLLEMVNDIDGVKRIKFVTSYPAKFDTDIFYAMAELPKVCEYLHIPCQSGSDKMLRAMNRRYTVADYIELMDMARRVVPDIAIAGDFIVGFPGETDDDFQASCELIKRVQYRNSFIFKYSPRTGTASAEKMIDDVPEQVKKDRNNALLAVQNEISLSLHKQMLGRPVEVIVESESQRSRRQPVPAPEGMVQLQGRTRGDHIVNFNGPRDMIGTIQTVTPTEATALALSVGNTAR